MTTRSIPTPATTGNTEFNKFLSNTKELKENAWACARAIKNEQERTRSLPSTTNKTYSPALVEPLSSELAQLGEVVRRARMARGLTLREVLPRSAGNLSEIERGLLKPSSSLARDLEKRLGLLQGALTELLRSHEAAGRAHKSPVRDLTADAEYLAREQLDPCDLVRIGLEKEYGRDGGAALAATVLSLRPTYWDVEVDCALADDPAADDQYVYSVRQSFCATLQRYTIAVVSTPALTETILARCTAVDEAWTVGAQEQVHHAVQQALESTTVAHISSAAGYTTNEVTELKEIDRECYGTYLSDIAPEHWDGIVLVGCEFPRRSGSRDRFVVEGRYIAFKSAAYCFWTADRPLFLRRLAFDVHDFTIAGKRPTLEMQLFMATIGSPLTQASRDRFVVDVDNWLVKGQGAILVWKP